MSVLVLICFVSGSEEIEVVIIIDLLVCGGVKVIIVSVVSDGSLIIVCLCGVKLLVDVLLVEVVDGDFDIIVFLGGIKGVECFCDSMLLVEIVCQFYFFGCIVVVICVVLVIVLVFYNLFLIGNMIGFLVLKEYIFVEQWQDKRVVWDLWVNLLISQGLGILIDFVLKMIDLLVGCEKVYEVVLQLVMVVGIYNYYEV